MKLKALIVICLMGFIGSTPSIAQQWTIEAEPICWSYNGVDSSLNRYVLVSGRSNQSRTLFYHDANQNLVDISAGGVLTYGYCDTLCGISSVTIDTFQLNGTSLELALNGGAVQSVDLSGLGVVSSPPILGQTSAPTNLRVFWKDTDDDTTRVYAPFGTEFKPLAYHHEMRAAIDSLRQAVIFQGKAILDTIPIIAGIDQARLDSMNVIGVTSTAAGWQASTAARDTLYPDAFAFQIYNTDSLIIAYSGVLVFPDSVYEKGRNYYQPYEYKKYQTSPDSILEQLVFKAVDTNVIEIRDRYSYLAENRLQSERSIPAFNITIEDFTSQSLLFAFQPDESTTTRTGANITLYTDPITGETVPNYSSFTPDFNAGPPDFIRGGVLRKDNVLPVTDQMTVVLKVQVTDGFNSGGAFFGKSGDTDTDGLIHQSFRYYMRLDGSLTQLFINNGAAIEYVFVINLNPAGAQILWTGRSSFFNIGAYTNGPNWDDILIGGQNGGVASRMSETDAKMFGLYYLSGNATLQEAKDMIDNWDLYHKY